MDTPNMIRVVMADDHRLFLTGLQRLFDEQSDIVVVATAGTGADAIEAARREKPDVLLLDVDMPGGNAFFVADHLAAGPGRPPRIILLTMHNELPFILAASRPDIQGYVLKDAAFEELVQAVRCVHGGGRFFGNGTALPPLASKKSFSPREKDILRCAALGKSNQQTADELGISIKTVETHRSHILKKLGVTNITEAVHVAGMLTR